MEKLVLVPYEKYQRLLDSKTMEKKTPNPPKRRERTVLKKKGPPGERDKLGLLRVSEYSDIRGSEFKIEYEYSSLPKSLDCDLFFFFFFYLFCY